MHVCMMAKSEPTYLSGEPIHKGDVARHGSWGAVVEDIITEGCDGWSDYWRDATGEGVMLVGPAFGRMFTKFDDEDLSFVRRQQS
jgi:hypothetical protein